MTTADNVKRAIRRHCSVPGCDRPFLAKGFCNAHYRKFKKYGSPTFQAIRPPGLTLEEALRFHGWVPTPGPLQDECWIWSGLTNIAGYGRLYFEGKDYVAHRASYETWVGEVPEGLIVRHRCDSPGCMNPKHLVPGSYQDNHDDMVSRGRERFADPEDFPHSKLDWGKVDEIRNLRAEGKTLEQIASRYSVNRSTIGYVVRGDTWTR